MSEWTYLVLTFHLRVHLLPWSTNKVRWNAWLLRLCHIFLLDDWSLIPDIRRDPTRIHCLERSNESQPGPASLRASRKRIDLPEPEGLICNETGEFAKIIITDASQCWYLHKHDSATLPCKRSTVTTHPQQCREENHGPSHCGSPSVSLGKYCKNPVTSRDYEHLNNAIVLFAPMAACCTPSVDMAISQTWQPKVTNTIPHNFSKAFCWIEISWILPKGLSINLCETDSTVFPQQTKLRFAILISSVSFGPNACGN